MSFSTNNSEFFHDMSSDPATTYFESYFNFSIAVVGLVALVTLYSVYRSFTDKAGKIIPSGPRGFPIVG